MHESASVEDVGTLIVGAGPAGLALGACLRREGVSFVLLEKGESVASAWHGHYDRLRLHTVKEHSALPFLPFPDDVPRYPTRDQVCAYLRDYALRFGLRPRLQEEALLVRPHEGGGWEVATSRALYRARRVVVATGYNRLPDRPRWPGEDAFPGPVLHSAEYRNGRPFRGMRVLVVGMGNTGAEIALDLLEHGARPSISVRGPVNVVPREYLGTPSQVTGIRMRRLPRPLRDAIGRFVSRRAFGDLRRYGLEPAPYGPITQIEVHRRTPVIDVGTLARIRSGEIRVVPDLARFSPTGAVFADGSGADFDAVVLATGYRTGIDRLVEGAGKVTDASGNVGESPLPGLFFLGFGFPQTGFLRQIALDAPVVARQIAARARR